MDQNLVERSVATSAANSIGAVSVGTVRRKLLFVTAKYSAAPTQAGVTVTLNSGAGAAYDAVLNTGSANAQTTVWIPDGDVITEADDSIDVSAPAGGGVITSSIAVYTQVL